VSSPIVLMPCSASRCSATGPNTPDQADRQRIEERALGARVDDDQPVGNALWMEMRSTAGVTSPQMSNAWPARRWYSPKWAPDKGDLRAWLPGPPARHPARHAVELTVVPCGCAGQMAGCS
jgi:hypothetical protein